MWNIESLCVKRELFPRIGLLLWARGIMDGGSNLDVCSDIYSV